MKKFRFISVVLAVSLLFSVSVSADFSDMPTDEGLKVAIENAVANGILSGYEDGTVRPDAKITRAEMASIITRACGATVEADISEFSDVPADSWFYSAFAKAYYMGAFSGDDQMHMNPQNNITFQECFTVLSRVFYLLAPFEYIPADKFEHLDELEDDNHIAIDNRLYDASVLNDYADGASVAKWAKSYVAGIVLHGGWNGENGNLTPTDYISRGQFAIVMNNLFQNYIDEPGTYTELPAGNTIIRANDVILDGVNTDYDILIADSVEQSGVVVNNVKAKNFTVRGCSTPVDENGELLNEGFGIVITGEYNAIYVIGPYITADISSAAYESGYSSKTSNIIVYVDFNFDDIG